MPRGPEQATGPGSMASASPAACSVTRTASNWASANPTNWPSRWIRRKSIACWIIFLPQPGAAGVGPPRALGKLRSLMEVARALQNSLSTERSPDRRRGRRAFRHPLRAGIPAAPQKQDSKWLPRAMTRPHSILLDLRVPTSVIPAGCMRRDLLSMSFDPLESRASARNAPSRLSNSAALCVCRSFGCAAGCRKTRAFPRRKIPSA